MLEKGREGQKTSNKRESRETRVPEERTGGKTSEGALRSARQPRVLLRLDGRSEPIEKGNTTNSGKNNCTTIFPGGQLFYYFNCREYFTCEGVLDLVLRR
jgi:hypothetical protein